MRRSYLFAFCLLSLALLAFVANAGTYTLLDGQALSGDPVSFNEIGLIVKQGDGSFSPRTPWEKFSQESLKALKTEANSQKEKDFIEPFIEDSPQNEANQRKVEIKEVPKPPRPTGDTGASAIFSSPVFVVIFLILYAANIFAAYEIAFYKNRPPMMVCGISAAAPFIGPIVFLAIPGNPDPAAKSLVEAMAPPKPSDEPEPVPSHEEPAEPVHAETNVPQPSTPAPSTSHQPNFRVGTAAQPASPAPATPPSVVFKRGEFTFNKRFFETKMPGFFRVVPSEAEKDMVLDIKSARGHFIGKRIANITQTELYLQVFKENATHDEMIPFTEIHEVQIRHKDAS